VTVVRHWGSAGAISGPPQLNKKRIRSYRLAGRPDPLVAQPAYFGALIPYALSLR
jgi:hypothetical protein